MVSDFVLQSLEGKVGKVWSGSFLSHVLIFGTVDLYIVFYVSLACTKVNNLARSLLVMKPSLEQRYLVEKAHVSVWVALPPSHGGQVAVQESSFLSHRLIIGIWKEGRGGSWAWKCCLSDTNSTAFRFVDFSKGRVTSKCFSWLSMHVAHQTKVSHHWEDRHPTGLLHWFCTILLSASTIKITETRGSPPQARTVWLMP